MYFKINFNKMCFIIAAPLDNTASKPMLFKDRVSYSVKSAASALIPSQPAPPSDPKPVTLRCKGGQPEKRPHPEGGLTLSLKNTNQK